METTDIWFASYLQVVGYKLLDFDVLSKGKGRYYFDINDVDWKAEKLNFSNSQISQVKMNFTALKDLLY